MELGEEVQLGHGCGVAQDAEWGSIAADPRLVLALA